MHAVLVKADRSLVWSEVPGPAPGPDEVLIEVHAAALNRADLMQRAGDYPPPLGWPEWMGLEVGGLVRHAPAGGRQRWAAAKCWPEARRRTSLG